MPFDFGIFQPIFYLKNRIKFKRKYPNLKVWKLPQELKRREKNKFETLMPEKSIKHLTNLRNDDITIR
jgi:hypothetical protein